MQKYQQKEEGVKNEDRNEYTKKENSAKDGLKQRANKGEI
jgi:hypothetical protein